MTSQEQTWYNRIVKFFASTSWIASWSLTTSRVWIASFNSKNEDMIECSHDLCFSKIMLHSWLTCLNFYELFLLQQLLLFLLFSASQFSLIRQFSFLFLRNQILLMFYLQNFVTWYLEYKGPWLTYDIMRCISFHTIHFNRATHFLFCVMASSHDSPGSPVEIFPNHSPEISSFKEQTFFQQDHIRFYTITVQKIGRKNTRKNIDFSKKCLNLVQVSLLTIGRFVNDAIRIRNVNSENLLLILFNVTIHNVYLVAFVPVGCLLDERHLLGVGIRNVDDVIEHNFHVMVRFVGRSRKERKHIDTCENDAWDARKERPECGSRLHWTEHVLKLTYFDEVNCERENTMVVRSEHIVVHLLLSFTHTNLQPRTSF